MLCRKTYEKVRQKEAENINLMENHHRMCCISQDRGRSYAFVLRMAGRVRAQPMQSLRIIDLISFPRISYYYGICGDLWVPWLRSPIRSNTIKIFVSCPNRLVRNSLNSKLFAVSDGDVRLIRHLQLHLFPLKI
jgi:hypothetical protein